MVKWLCLEYDESQTDGNHEATQEHMVGVEQSLIGKNGWSGRDVHLS